MDPPKVRSLFNISADAYFDSLHCSVRNALKNKRVILASGSEQRRTMLKRFDIDVEVIPSNYDEKDSPSTYPTPYEYAIDMAYKKAMIVAEKHQAELVIGADTIIVHENEVFGKPKSKEHAKEMLMRMSGKTHNVYTGLALVWADRSVQKSHANSRVTMKPFSEDTARAYVDSGEPMGKAGAYAIQGSGSALMEKVDETDVVEGLSLFNFLHEVFNHYIGVQQTPQAQPGFKAGLSQQTEPYQCVQLTRKR